MLKNQGVNTTHTGEVQTIYVKDSEFRFELLEIIDKLCYNGGFSTPCTAVQA